MATDDLNFDELNAQAENGELTDESLQEKLNQYSLALQQEYETKTEVAPENIEEYTRDFFKKNIHMAAAQIVWLAGNASKESTKLNAAKYVVEAALAEGRADGDPIKELLRSLQNSPSKTTG